MCSFNLSELDDFINARIKVGWQPFGSPYCRVWDGSSQEVVHYQAMVKYEQELPKPVLAPAFADDY